MRIRFRTLELSTLGQRNKALCFLCENAKINFNISPIHTALRNENSESILVYPGLSNWGVITGYRRPPTSQKQSLNPSQLMMLSASFILTKIDILKIEKAIPLQWTDSVCRTQVGFGPVTRLPDPKPCQGLRRPRFRALRS